MRRVGSECDFSAVVEQVRPDGVVLSETRFVPTTADRASDVGVVGAVRVLSAERLADGSVLHTLEPESSWQSLIRFGDSVNAVVDWQSRFIMQRLHTALHLAYFAYVAVSGPAQRVARWISPGEAYLEIYEVSEPVDDVAVSAIEQWVRRAIIDDLTISSVRDSAADSRRYWHIDGIGTLACVGSHPFSTGDVGEVVLSVVTLDRNSIRVAVRVF